MFGNFSSLSMFYDFFSRRMMWKSWKNINGKWVFEVLKLKMSSPYSVINGNNVIFLGFLFTGMERFFLKNFVLWVLDEFWSGKKSLIWKWNVRTYLISQAYRTHETTLMCKFVWKVFHRKSQKLNYSKILTLNFPFFSWQLSCLIHYSNHKHIVLYNILDFYRVFPSEKEEKQDFQDFHMQNMLW